MPGVIILYTLISGLIVCMNAGTVQQIYIKDNKVPVKGVRIQLVCEVSQFTNDVVRVYKTNFIPPDDLTNIPSLTKCTSSSCLGAVTGYTFSTDSTGVTITVNNLDRSEDQKYWTCSINNQRSFIKLTVYTITSTLQFDDPPSQNQDLIQNTVTIKCITRCAHPSPNFTWYYIKTGGPRQEWSVTTAPVTDRTGGCTDYEKIYTSTLTLSRYTQFPDNTDTTVKYQCGAISITGAENQLFTQESVEVRFAVRVSTLALNDGNSAPSNPLEVNSGEPHTLTCTSSVSRPTATIIWYVGGQEQKREAKRTSSFTFTPNYSDDQKQVTCEAFNINSGSQTVSSNVVSLYVKVKVTNVSLKEGNTTLSGTLVVTNGESKTLTCTASESRPKATIIWYIGGVEKKSETVTLSTFTFTPVISDHSKQVYCKASQSGNTDVLSNEISLNVKVLASTPAIKDLTKEKFEGDQMKYQCTSSQTRPVAIITWKLDTQVLTDVQKTEHSHEKDLKSVSSIVTFTANRTDNNKTIHCETAIPGQINLAKVHKMVTVYWPPSSPHISTSNFPFLEGQTGKSVYCSSSDNGNPKATATWIMQYGTPDHADTMKLWLPNLTYKFNGTPLKCQLKNLFTQKKSLQVQSKQVLLQVEYSSRIQILVDGKQVNTITKNESQTLSAKCNASGNPNPVVNWTAGQPSRGPSLTFDDIDRTDHGKYTCRATASSNHYPSHNFITEEELNVIVNYAPDIIVYVNGRNPTENNTLTINCEPEGRPADYYFSSIVHKWGDVVITEVLNPTNGVIEVQNAQLQDSGTYICVANNGIRDRNQKLDQSGNNTVKVKVSPKILLKVDDRKFFGKLGFAANITAPFYSDPPPKTVQFKFQNGTVITNSDKNTVSFFKGNVKDTFYGKEVELDGFFAQLQIRNEEESDFVNYTLVIYNGIGSYKSWLLEHVYENTPNVPRNVSLAKKLSTDNSLTVQWNPGNDNGHKQTFILKYRNISDMVWSVISILDMGYLMNYTISGLTSGTYYEIILYASNTVGNSEEAHLIGKTTGKPAECDSSCVSTTNIQAIVVGIVLGCINLLLLTYAGYVTLLLKRKGGQKHENASCRAVNNVPVYTNIVYSTNESDEQQGTALDDSGDCQYTSLKNQLRDEKETYDVLGLVS